ncbi:hypothetical protein [Streptomyces sp. NPDC059009]|uniref:hypothetical protein n=1 Tax=Streptomyces sp. NPDC059009 TaxID=3346694 RepID=UPI0036B46481
MRNRTHATHCDYGLVSAGESVPCTCGVSPVHLTADQVIRVIALQHAMQRAGGYTKSVLAEAKDFETYIRGGGS